jgi:hypothetical protein
VNSVITPPIIHPIAPPNPVDSHISVTKSCEPKLGSLLDYITIIASLTTFVKASDIDAIASTIATTSGSSNSKQYRENKDRNYRTPMIVK